MKCALVAYFCVAIPIFILLLACNAVGKRKEEELK